MLFLKEGGRVFAIKKKKFFFPLQLLQETFLPSPLCPQRVWTASMKEQFLLHGVIIAVSVYIYAIQSGNHWLLTTRSYWALEMWLVGM